VRRVEFIQTKEIINIDNTILVNFDNAKKNWTEVRLSDIRFLDPPEEEKTYDLSENYKGIIERLLQRVKKLEELCKAGDLYKVKALDINVSDLSVGYEDLSKRLEKLEEAHKPQPIPTMQNKLITDATLTMQGEPDHAIL
jgi:hypothetical protein